METGESSKLPRGTPIRHSLGEGLKKIETSLGAFTSRLSSKQLILRTQET